MINKVPNVAVVILNWNGKEILKTFLPSVINYSKEAELVIVDNGSTDNSLLFIKEEFPQIRVIDNKQNYGFAGGYNKALKEIEADYYVLLNSDVEVSPNWLSPIIELMESDSQIACCQPKLLSYLEKNKFEYAGGAGGFIDHLGYPFCRGRIFNFLEEDKGQYDDSREIFWATGAALFVRASIYKEFNGLDNDFFAHQEEIDFCWRVKNSGYKVYYCPKSVCYHLGGGTLNKTSPFKTFLNFRNNLYLLYKNLPLKKRKRVFFMRFFLDIIASISFLIQGKVGEFNAVYKAYIEFTKTKKQMKQKRKPIINNNIKEIYSGSIVFSYYAKKKKRFSELKF
jgi:GT2 family glycosyltransferase